VAREAGVSQPTVSRVLRGDPRVLPDTKARILNAVEALGYVPASAGRNLRTRSSGQVAMVADLGNPLYPRLMEPVHDVLAEGGLRMVLLTERDDDTVLQQHLFDRSVDGVLLTTTSQGSRLPRELRRRDVPFVFLNRYLPGVSADRVVADNRAGGRAVAELLLGLGHRDIAVLMGTREASTSQDRERGFREVLEARGVALDPRRVAYGGYSHEDGVAGFARVFDRDRPPTALFCVNDFVAVGAMNAAIVAGVDVPGELAVVGFDDVGLASWPAFSLSTVHVPVADMARTAAGMLVDRIRGTAPHRPRHQSYDTYLVLRNTHGRPRS
jgi:LacI family transcriptional regulator